MIKRSTFKLQEDKNLGGKVEIRDFNNEPDILRIIYHYNFENDKIMRRIFIGQNLYDRWSLKLR